MAHQSGWALPAVGRKARWREMRRSELVTVPSFSPQPVAGSRMSATAVVSVSATQSDTTTVSQRSSARRQRSASGRLTSGLVARIQMNFTLPRSTASNRSRAFSPGLLATFDVPQKSPTALRSSSLKLRWTASWFASPPTSRPPMALAWPVMEKGLAPGRPTRPVARWQLRMALPLSVPLLL